MLKRSAYNVRHLLGRFLEIAGYPTYRKFLYFCSIAMYFNYTDKETDYLKSRCKKMAEVIDRVGLINRVADDDLFSSVVHHIIGQQISTHAQQTIWQRMQDMLGTVSAETIDSWSVEELQRLGMTFRKAEYIKDFCHKVLNGEFDLGTVEQMSDEEAIKALSSLKGIGVWTAEMILLFCLQRPDVLSYGDLAIQRGLRMVYHHREITPKIFERYRRRFSPCGSVASLYLWAVASGRYAEYKDYQMK
jgi:DNA-3-methyladenine glycosylase II